MIEPEGHSNPPVSIIDRRSLYAEKLRRTGATRTAHHLARVAKGARIKQAVAERSAAAKDLDRARVVLAIPT